MYEWEEHRRIENFQAHGVDFVRAARMFDNPVLEIEDKRQFYGEPRIMAIGHVEGWFMVVTYSPRGKARRIITAWKASDEDEAIYRAKIPTSARSYAGPHPERRALAGEPRRGLLEAGRARLAVLGQATDKAKTGS